MLLALTAFCGWMSASAQTAVGAYDGSYRLESGEVITGGYIVEGAKGRYVFMDPLGLDKAGLFEKQSGHVLSARGMLADQSVTIEFIENDEGAFNSLVWRESGAEPMRGERVFPLHSRTVEFESADGTQLQGRLLTPDCPGPHPVIITAHGSGPVDRHGGPFHTFFIQHGMAVLAWDKRGYTNNPDEWQEPGFAELSADIAAAVSFAASLPEIDTDRIGIFGSSQGGWTAPPAAVSASETDYLIVRVGPSISALETILHETRQELRAEGLSGLELDYAMDLRREIYRLALAGKPLSATDSLVKPYLQETWYQTAFGEGYISKHWSQWWWQRAQKNLDYSPEAALAEFAGPVIWFLAEEDENVPLVPTRAALQRAFATSPGEDQKIVIIEDAPHSFFIETEGGVRYADGFFNYMADWLRKRDYTDQSCWANHSQPAGTNQDDH